MELAVFTNPDVAYPVDVRTFRTCAGGVREVAPCRERAWGRGEFLRHIQREAEDAEIDRLFQSISTKEGQ